MYFGIISMFGQDVKYGLKFLHSDFQCLKQLIKMIALIEIMQGWLALLYFGPVKESYPTLLPSFTCFSQHLTTSSAINETVNILMDNVLENEGTDMPRSRFEKLIVFNAILLMLAGIGLYHVAISESYVKCRIWLNFYVFQCLPSILLFVTSIRILINALSCNEENDPTDTDDNLCQIVLFLMILMWDILLAYFGYIVSCFMEKIKPKYELEQDEEASDLAEPI